METENTAKALAICGFRGEAETAETDLCFTLDVTRNRAQVEMVIRSFRCKHTEALFAGEACHKDWRSFRKVAERKLQMLNRAVVLSDMKIPPNNCLEVLKRDRAGQHSVRINDQYRVCFVWTTEGPTDVEIVDYH